MKAKWEHVLVAHVRKNEDKVSRAAVVTNNIKIEEFMLRWEDINDVVIMEEVGSL